MKVQDDRTPAQKAELTWLVVGTDSFLSGWGGSAGGNSFAAWACRDHKHAAQVEEWVKARSDMKRVHIAKEPYRPAGDCVHLHIYIAADCCPEGWKE